MGNFKRKKLLVDSRAQGLLVLRVAAYWVSCMATMEFVSLTWLIATGPEQSTFVGYFVQYDWRAAMGRLLVGSLLLAPIAWDMLSFSNRLAGPIFRIRRTLREVAQGRVVEPVRLRNRDYWHGLADDLNAALQSLAPQQIQARSPAEANAGRTNVVPQNGATGPGIAMAKN